MADIFKGKIYDNDPPGYAKKVAQFEKEGMTTSDAQGAADVHFNKKPLKNYQAITKAKNRRFSSHPI